MTANTETQHSYKRINSQKEMKAFKDYEIEDFVDMGSAHQLENTDGHIPFVPFCRTKEKMEYIRHPVSNLEDVLKAL